MSKGLPTLDIKDRDLREVIDLTCENCDKENCKICGFNLQQALKCKELKYVINNFK